VGDRCGVDPEDRVWDVGEADAEDDGRGVEDNCCDVGRDVEDGLWLV
jgi:hypothetical protein